VFHIFQSSAFAERGRARREEDEVEKSPAMFLISIGAVNDLDCSEAIYIL